MPMKKGIFLYEKGDSIIIKLDIKKITSNDYIHISNLDENNILDLEYNSYKFPNPINKIFKINYLSTPYFKIEGDDSNRYYISYVDKTTYDTIDKCLGNLIFNKSNDNIYIKPINVYYGILIVEIINKMINTTLALNELVPPIKELNFDSEQTFNSFYSKYQLEYEKKVDNEILIFMYKMNEYSNNFRINIIGPNDYAKTEMFDDTEKIGSYGFENGETGKYDISFKSTKSFEGTFKIVKASEPIKININEYIKLNAFNAAFHPKPIIIEFNSKGLSDNTYKEFLIGGNNNNLNLIQISSDDSKYKSLTLNYYAFEKEKEYKIKIEYNDLGNNQYKFEQFIINTFKFELEDFQYGSKKYQNNATTQFIKIDLTKFSKIVVKADNDPIFKIAYYNDDLDMAKILNDLVFEDLKNYTISDISYKKAVLAIQLKPVETIIDFSDGSGEDDKSDEDDDEDDDYSSTEDGYLAMIGLYILIGIIYGICQLIKGYKHQPDIDGEDQIELPMQNR